MKGKERTKELLQIRDTKGTYMVNDTMCDIQLNSGEEKGHQ